MTVFNLHMMGAIENAGPSVEFSIEPNSYYPWQEGLFDPGWGVEINPDWLNRATRQVSEVT